jgi:hypothetical protein
MRSTSLILAAVAGLAASAFAAPAGALTPNSSAGIRAAAESVDPLANVHCRSFKHRSYNHGWGFGCRVGGVSVNIHEREGVRVRGRVGIHEREGTRARVGIHERSTTRSSTNVRSRESTTARGEARTSTTRSSTTGKSGTTGNRSESRGGGGGTGGQSSGGGGTGGQSSGGTR